MLFRFIFKYIGGRIIEEVSECFGVLFWQLVAVGFRKNFALDDVQHFCELAEGIISASFSDSSKVLIVQINKDVYITFFGKMEDDLEGLLGPAIDNMKFGVIPDCENLVICCSMKDFL